MSTERALEIIAAYGADSARWPDAERDVMLALAAGDPRIAAALDDAHGLDALLGAWARDVAPADFDIAAITGSRRVTRSRFQVTRWVAGGALAAAVGAGIAVLAPVQPVTRPVQQTVSTNSPVLLATAEGNGSGSDAEAFAAVFTPTVDEDELI